MNAKDILATGSIIAGVIGLSILSANKVKKVNEKAKAENLAIRLEYIDHVNDALKGRSIDREAIDLTLGNTSILNQDDRAYAYGYFKNRRPFTDSYPDKYSIAAFDRRLSEWDNLRDIFTRSTGETLSALIANWRNTEAETARLAEERRKEEAEARIRKEAIAYERQLREDERREAKDIRDTEFNKYKLIADSFVKVSTKDSGKDDD